MPEPLRDLIRFALALWREWQVLLTGGSIVALLALWAFATGKTIPQNLAWLVIGLTALNVVSTLLECGFGACAEDPVVYELLRRGI